MRQQFRASSHRDGYDARGVAVLALAIIAMAIVLGFAIREVRGGAGVVPQAPTASETPLLGLTLPGHATPVGGVGEQRDLGRAGGAVPAAGIDLVAGRVSARRSPATGRMSIVVRAANVGADALEPAAGGMLMVVVDGALVGARPLALAGATSAGPAARNELFELDQCTSGTHSVTAIVDATGRIDEANEADNARSAQLAWRC